MSSNGVTPFKRATSFGRWQTGRNPRWATRDVCLSHLSKLPGKGGVGGGVLPASSFLTGAHPCQPRSAQRFAVTA